MDIDTKQVTRKDYLLTLTQAEIQTFIELLSSIEFDNLSSIERQLVNEIKELSDK